MIDWDDVRHFLAIARAGSVRAASERLGVNHSTVLRRIAQLEQRLGAQIFEKLPSGYRLTEAGAEILPLAEGMEAASHQLEGRVFGRDQAARGKLRVTMAPLLASHLLMPDLAAFAALHPEVELEILSIAEPVNLTNREADVAIRVVYDRDALPPHLHGVKGPPLFGGIYAAQELLACRPERPRWINTIRHGTPDWARALDLAAADVPFWTSDSGAQLAAVRQGLGLTTLPCFVGDADPRLARVPGTPRHLHGTVWLLFEGDTRKTRRVRLFIDHMARRLASHAPLLAGHEDDGG